MMKKITLLTGILCMATGIFADKALSNWAGRMEPYRIELKVNPKVTGEVQLDISLDKIVAELKKVCPDPLTVENFAFDSAVLCNASGKEIGKFRLVSQGPSILEDGDFSQAVKGKSPWKRWNYAGNSIVKRQNGGLAIWTRQKSFVFAPVMQKVKLNPGSLYLTEYDIYSNVQMGGGSAYLNVVEKKSIGIMTTSYVPKLPPQRQWSTQRRLQRAWKGETDFWLNNTCKGEIAFSNVSCRPVRWQLFAHFDSPKTQSVYLYYCPRAGHELTVPEDFLEKPQGVSAIPVEYGVAETMGDNSEKFYIESGGISAWQIDPGFPLILSRLSKTKPANPKKTSIKLPVAKGERRIILLAIDTKGLDFNLKKAEVSKLPLVPEIKRLAAVPVYENHTKDKLLEVRLDAMVDVNYSLVPMHKNAPQILCLTFNADAGNDAGTFDGSVSLELETSEKDLINVQIPIALKILPISVKPMRHVPTNMGGQELFGVWKLPGGEMFPPAYFHGYRDKSRFERRAFMDTLFTSEKRIYDPLRDLAGKYWNRLLDFQLQPMTPTLLYPMTYHITETSEDGHSSPIISNWDWSFYDKAIREFVIKREMTQFTLMHTTGSRMDFLTLCNGVTYGCRAHTPADSYKPYKHLNEMAFYNLVGQFFEDWAKHLEELGVLDSAYICIDETLPCDYPKVVKWLAAIKSRPHAKKIKIYHTNQHTEYYTMTENAKPDSPLVLHDIDINAPENDDRLNNFLQKDIWNPIYGKNKTTWVYYVDTEHFWLDTAGLNTILLPLKLEPYGVNGFHHFAMYLWSYPMKIGKYKWHNGKYDGPMFNPWDNPYYHHGAGTTAFFYPPDPRGPSEKPNDTIIPSFRLALLREGIQDRSLWDIVTNGKDDTGKPLKITSEQSESLRHLIGKLWINPVQWRTNRRIYNKWKKELYDLLDNASKP